MLFQSFERDQKFQRENPKLFTRSSLLSPGQKAKVSPPKSNFFVNFDLNDFDPETLGIISKPLYKVRR